MSEYCQHTRFAPGPRIDMRYGSGPTDICLDCGSWRPTLHFVGYWRHASELLDVKLVATCEWNPTADRAAQEGDEWHADTVWSVGSRSPNWHLCQSCSELPTFKRLTKRVRIGGAP